MTAGKMWRELCAASGIDECSVLLYDPSEAAVRLRKIRAPLSESRNKTVRRKLLRTFFLEAYAIYQLRLVPASCTLQTKLPRS